MPSTLRNYMWDYAGEIFWSWRRKTNFTGVSPHIYTTFICISLAEFIPWIIVVSFTSVTNAFVLSDLKLDKVDKPFPSVINVFWFCVVVSFKIDKLVLYEFNVPNTLKPDKYNDPFIFVVLFKLVNPLTFN